MGAARRRAAESTKVDFATFQRRIHSLQQADGTLPDQMRNRHHSLLQADGQLIKLNLNELYVTSYETDPGDGTVERDDTTTTDTSEAARTHPRVCAHSRYYWCVTYQVGCESGGGAVC